MFVTRVLIVGFGSIGKRHLQIGRKLLPQADIRILSRREFSEIPKFADGYFSNVDEALNFLPEIAIIANAATFHLEIALKLAGTGTHLLIEKPLSSHTTNVKELIELCKQKQIILLVGYNLRFDQSLKKFRELLISDNLIGRILSFRCEMGQFLPSWRPETDYRKTVSAKSNLGGGVLLELSHELDYIRWIFGEVNWVSAKLVRQSDLEVDVEDSAHIILGLSPRHTEKEIVGVLSLDFIRQDVTRICTAIGETGSLRWNGVTGEVDLYKMNGNEWLPIYSYKGNRNETYIAEWTHFLACIDGTALPECDGENGLALLNIVSAARRSSEYRKQVNLIER